MRRAWILAALLVVAACSDRSGEETPDTLRILSHDSFRDAVTEETFAAFTEETGIAVEVIAAGDAGSMVNQAILSKDNPLADVLFGVDDTFLSRALDNEIFVPHTAAGIETVDPGMRIEGDPVTPIDFGDVCVNYDKEWFEANGVAIPDSLDDLRKPEYARLLVVTHPATSSPGLAFLFATIQAYGDGWKDFWADLKAGGVRVESGWSEAYYEAFTRYGGDRPLVLSYASSPPAEVMFAEEPLDEAPTGVMTDGCYRQVEYAGVLVNTGHTEAARKLVDFMLSEAFQAQIPDAWFVYPANGQVELPEVWEEHTVLPDDPARLDPAEIGSERESWIDEWTEILEG